MGAIYDNLEFIMDKRHQESAMEKFEYLLQNEKIEIASVTHIRGRSLPKQYMIVDDAQKLTPHEMKTILSRAGEGTKVVVTGDPYQIDNPYVDSTNNGLVHVVNRQSFHWSMELHLPWGTLAQFAAVMLGLAVLTALASGRRFALGRLTAIDHEHRSHLCLRVALHLGRQLADLGGVREDPVPVGHDADGQRPCWHRRGRDSAWFKFRSRCASRRSDYDQ